MTVARRRGRSSKELVPILGLREWNMSSEWQESNTKKGRRKNTAKVKFRPSSNLSPILKN